MMFFLFAEEQMLTHGYPAYTTSCAWLGYSDQQLKQVCFFDIKILNISLQGVVVINDGQTFSGGS